MKVNVKVSDSAERNIARGVKRMANGLGDKGQAFAEELTSIIEELQSQEAEISLDEVLAAVEGKVKEYKAEGAEAIANAVAEMKATVAKMQNGINASANGSKLPVAVKNEICTAMLGARTKAEVKDAVEKVLVKNEVTGLTFSDIVSYEIVDNWGDEQGLYGALKQVPYTKFFYNDDDLSEANILAKQWSKDSSSAKAVQTIATDGKTISTKYIYKKQKMANEDMDAIKEAGEGANFVNYITKELRRQYCNTIVKRIVAGESTITTFETIGGKTASDIFTTVKNPEGATLVYGDLFKTVLEVKNAAEAVVYIDKAAYAACAAFTYADGGTEDFRGIEVLKGLLGVKDVVLYDLHTYTNSKVHAVVFVPSEYWVKEKGEKEVAYPNWEFNTENWLYECNAGGAIHGLKSSAVLRDAD